MLSQFDQKRLPSFRVGMRQGIVEGRVEGQVRILNR